MKNWNTLQPDRVRLLTKHFTPGRGGRKIRHVTIHHMAMVGGLDECWNVWQQREASAHYTVNPTGGIGQTVYDNDTAWANANLVSNQETIAIEHSNSAGANQDWPISEKTREEGAHLVAAICVYYKLGRPVSGTNVRFHNSESGGITSCPYHLRPGGKYHDAYMRRAQYWYDQMTKAAPSKPAATAPKPAPVPAKAGGTVDKAQADRIEKKLDLVLDQLVGPDKDAKGPFFSGWKQLDGKTLVDAVADIRNAFKGEKS